MVVEKLRGEHGWYIKQERVYAPLLKCDAVRNWSETLDAKNARKSKLYSLWILLEDNHLGPEEFLGLTDKGIKQAFKHTLMRLQSEKKSAFARRTFYAVRSFLDFNDKWDDMLFERDEKKVMLNRGALKKIGRQYIPSKEDVYRMADASPTLRDKAILICLYQSGVRGGCLSNWSWKMFKDTLFTKDKISGESVAPKYPVKVFITANEDSKISSYGVTFYLTFLNVEAGEALREYLTWRMMAKKVRFGSGEYSKDGRRKYREEVEQWEPKDDDYLFVTEGTVSRGRKLNIAGINEVVKRSAERVGIDPATVWPHTFRKSFRKTLYSAGVGADLAETLMGHRLAGSRGNYFDYHDEDLVARQYAVSDFGRTTSSRIVRNEEKLNQLEAENQALKQRLDQITAPQKQTIQLMEQLLEDPQIVELLKRKIGENKD